MKAKVLTWVTLVILLALGIFTYFRFFYVFADGVKAGELNQFAYKGYVWKTYEGRLIQAGFKGSAGNVGAASVHETGATRRNAKAMAWMIKAEECDFNCMIKKC